MPDGSDEEYSRRRFEEDLGCHCEVSEYCKGGNRSRSKSKSKQIKGEILYSIKDREFRMRSDEGLERYEID